MSPSDTSIATSGADLLASLPNDIFEGEVPSTGEETEGEVSETESEGADVVETQEETAAETEQPAETEEAKPEEAEKPEEKPTEEVTDDELPEGVKRGKDRSGKPGLFVTPERWQTIYDKGYKALQSLHEMAGQEVTPELFEAYQGAWMGQERLFSDLVSGQSGVRQGPNGQQIPTGQAGVINEIFNETARAVKEGEVAGNPMIPFTQQFYKTLQERDPHAYAALRAQAAKDLVEELYNESASKQDRNLYLALGHVADALNGVGLKFKPEAEMASFFAAKGQPADPTADLRKKVEELQNQLNGRTAQGQAAQFDAWKNSVENGISPAMLEDAVKPEVADIATQGAWKDNPDAFNDLVVSRLHKRVDETVRQDKGLKQKVTLLRDNAKRATSAQKRDEFGAQITQLFVNRAKLAVRALKPEVTREAANLLVEQSKRVHQRAAAGQTQKGPKGTGAPVAKSLIPNTLPAARPGEFFDPAKAARDLAALLS